MAAARHLSGWLLALLMLAALPASAGATAWPGYGGGPGRSGHDPLDHNAGTPVTLAWERTTSTFSENVRSGPIVTSGALSANRVVFGTEGGVLHVQRWAGGEDVGSVGIDGTAVDDPDTFGPNTQTTVAPVAVSSSLNPGQVYAVHNDDNQSGPDDIGLAQVDAASGALVQDVNLTGTSGYEIQSSPVVTDPDANGTVQLLFVASDGSNPRLYRVEILDAGSTSASWSTPTSAVVSNATLAASPALVWLENSAGDPTQYVALGTSGTNGLETYAVADFAAGPVAPGIATGQTPAVPLTADGLLPGAPKSGLAKSPVLYLASDNATATYVHKLEQSGAAQSLTVTSSLSFGGLPSRAMAVSRRVGTPAAGGVIALATNENLYVLETDDLSERARLSPTPLVGSDGFRRTVPALSDEFVFLMRDNARQLVLSTSDAQPDSGFTESTSNSGALFGFGGPALAAGRVFFGGDVGLFGYGTDDGTLPRVTLVAPPQGPVTGPLTVEAEAFDARGILQVQFRVDGVAVGTVSAPQPGPTPAHALPGALFRLTFDTSSLPNGQRLLQAVATDGGGLVAAPAATILVANPPGPDVDPPETSILEGPENGVSDTTPEFRFASDEALGGFECSLDGDAWDGCPEHLRLALVSGYHRLRVRAVDLAGNTDPTPSRARFTARAPGAVEVAAPAPVRLSAGGVAAVPVTCHSRRRCRGVLVLDVLVPRRASRATAFGSGEQADRARKGRKLRVGRRHFAVAARARRTVRVQLSAAGRRLVRRYGRLRAVATVKLRTPSGVKRSRWRLVLKRRSR